MLGATFIRDEKKGVHMPRDFAEARMIQWIRQQVLVLEAWREELASRPDVDLTAIIGVENHYHWLCKEMYRLETGQTSAPV